MSARRVGAARNPALVLLLAAVALRLLHAQGDAGPTPPRGADPRLANLVAATADRSPLGFEEFADADGATRFRARGRGYVLDVLPDEIRVASGARSIRMVLAGAHPVTLHGAGALGVVSHHFVGNDPAAWRLDVPHVGRVLAPGVYPGIDAVYYGHDGRLQYDFLVAPGADASAIRLAFPDSGPVRVDDDGRLLVGSGDEPMVLRAPVAFQEVDGTRRNVAARFALDTAAGEARIALGEYDAAHPLVIDPVLEFGTYWGATFPTTGAITEPANVAVDAAGNMYLAGESNGRLPLPTPPGGSTPQPAASDAYIAKFDPGGRLVATIVYGGSDLDHVNDVAVSPAGEIVIVGETRSPDLPGALANRSFDATLTGQSDGFVAKFSTDGTLQWVTYLGGGATQFDFESLQRVIVEPTGNVVVAGWTLDIGPLNGFDGTFNAGPAEPFAYDGIVVRFSSTGSFLEGTYLGTQDFDMVTALRRLRNGDIVVAGSTGTTFRTANRVTSPAYQPECVARDGEEQCAFVARLGANLRTLPVATFFGEQFGVAINDLAGAPDGAIVITGRMDSNGAIPATDGAFDREFGGFTEAFAARLPADLTSLTALTYLGGADEDAGYSVNVDSAAQVYVAGGTFSRDFPVRPGALKTTFDSSSDAFLVKLTSDLKTAAYASRLGGGDAEEGARAVLGPGGHVYIVGITAPNVTGSPGAPIPTTPNAIDRTLSAGATEAFLYRLSPRFDSSYIGQNTAAVSIPDLQSASTSISVSGTSGVLDDVEVSLHVTHPVRRQLRATLISPANVRTTVLVQPNTTATGANYGSACNAQTSFNDSALQPITTAQPPTSYVGEFRPATALDAFDGLTGAQVNGTWTLRIDDTVAGSIGTLQCWTLTLYFRRPEITSITPRAIGVPAPGEVVTIAGANFAPGTTVRIGGTLVVPTSLTPTLITVAMPAGVPPNPDVTVTSADGRSAFAVDPFNRVSFARSKIGSSRQGEAGFTQAASRQPSLSRDGRFQAFQSFDTHLIDDNGNFLPDDDTNKQPDIFVRDRAAATTTIRRVSVSSDGAQANGASSRPKISADGRYVAFVSAASNLVPGDTNGVADVFVHDRDADGDGIFDEREPGARATMRVSVSSNGTQGNAASGQHDLSPDGLWIAFVSAASNLVPFDTNTVDDVFLHHWPSGQTLRVSVATGGGQADAPSRAPGVSAGGRRVVFASDATNLVPEDTNGFRDVFAHDLADRTTTRISTAMGSIANANGASDNPSIDDRGATIAFQTRATNIAPAAPGGGTARWQVVAIRLPAVAAAALGTGRVELPVVNIADAIRNLLSGNAQGQPGGGDSTEPAVSGEGNGVAFESEAGDLVAGDTNGEQDVLVSSPAGGEPEIVSLNESDELGSEPSGAPALSDDGTAVTFESEADLTQNTEGTNFTNVFLRGNKLMITSIAPFALPLSGGDRTVTITGVNFVGPVQVRIGGVSAPTLSESATSVVVTAPASSLAGAANVTVSNSDGETQTAVNAFTFLASGADGDQDGLLDSFEEQFGLDPTSAAGPNGAGGDPDGDGVTNLEEQARGSHPNGTFQRFLAEGATNDFFLTRISLANPSATRALSVLLRFQLTSGTEVPLFVQVPPRQSRRVTVNDVQGMQQAEFATLVESDGLVVVDRQMSWNRQDSYGSHAEAAVRSTSLVWYLAEGATHSGFDLFYLLQNPSTEPAQVRVRYLLPSGAPLEKSYVVGPKSRFNIWVNLEQFPEGSGIRPLASTDVSAVLEVQNNVPIIVERAMYLTRDVAREPFAAGHESAGVTAPSTTWFLAEGATIDIFDMFVLLANPTGSDALAKVTYLLEDGRTFTRDITLPANSRSNIWVDFEELPAGSGQLPLLNAAFSTTVEVTNGVPIIVERAMWWPVDPSQWYEAHNSPGSAVTGVEWGLGDGAVGGSTVTYILVANTETARSANVAITLLFDGLGPVTRVFAVPPQTRLTVDVGREFPEARGREFGALVESVAAAPAVPAQIIVERALYNDARGQHWAAGTNQLATRIR